DEQAHQPDGEADRPETRSRDVRLAAGAHALSGAGKAGTSALCEPPSSLRLLCDAARLTLMTVRHSTAPRFRVSTTYRLHRAATARAILTTPADGVSGDPVLRPAGVDEAADVVAHADRLRPFACALRRPFGGRVDAELPAERLQCRRMVELVERP